MVTESTKRNKFVKVALTKKLEQCEKQIIVAPGQGSQSTLAEGQFLSHKYHEKIFVHGGHSTELVDRSIVSTAHPALLITLLLRGKLNFAYDDLAFDLQTDNGARGVVVNLTRPANFYRSMTKDNRVSKINILIKPNWLQERYCGQNSLEDFLAIDKSHFELIFDSRLTDLLEEVLSNQKPDSLLEKIEIESLVQQIIVACLKQVPERSEQVNILTTVNSDLTVEDIVSYIETNLNHQLTLTHLSAHFNMSISKLQRLFKQAYNLTINGYIRARRLDNARQQIERGLISITQAAYEAGYQHPANFTHAFKKEFGRSPYQWLNDSN
ncbi:AraC family transcriptional regulator [Vibrio ponticus]|uniref:AraC family transcriptional regulator n=1 Tax=Vibrio ponticus TaxID=265668 RepID=A0A3N3DVT7_9VIBR|nr:AraC family transcriptional regulator [Vibrio ponticus]ROV58298.1 AraC family transcriptional regulator [Vibrio ponticus]